MRSLILLTAFSFSLATQATTKMVLVPTDATNPQIVSLIKEKLYTGKNELVPCSNQSDDCVNGYKEVGIYADDLMLTVTYESYEQARRESDGGAVVDLRVYNRTRFPLSTLNEQAHQEYALNKKLRKPSKENRAWAAQFFALEIKEKAVTNREIDYAASTFCAEDDNRRPVSPGCVENIVYSEVPGVAKFLKIESR